MKVVIGYRTKVHLEEAMKHLEGAGTATSPPPARSESLESSPDDHCGLGTRCSHLLAIDPDPLSYTDALQDR